MQKLLSLLLDSLHHFRMAMPRRTNGDTSREIQKYVSIHILDPKPLPLFNYKRMVPGI